MKNLVKKILVDWSTPITILFALVSLAGAYYARHIELKLSLTDLLPQEHPNVVKFNKLVEVVGGVGYHEIVLHAEDGKSHLEIAPKLVEKFKSVPMVRSSFFQREEHFFLSHALYYMKLDELEKLDKTIAKEITQAKRKVFDIGLWDEDEKGEGGKKKKDGLEVDPELKKTANRFGTMSPFLISEDKKHLLLMVKPDFDSLDMGKNKILVASTDAILKETLPPNVTYKMSGRYYSKVRDAQMMEGDMEILGIVSNILMAVILVFYFRSITGVISIFIPVVLGLGLTALITKLVIGHINIITGFLIGIISGIGSDYGIHMLWRLRLEQEQPSSSDPDPLWRVLQTAGWANFVTIISSGLCFFFMCFSSLKIFSEFGFVFGVGLTSILFAKLLSFHCTSRLLKLHKISEVKLPFAGRELFLLRTIRSLYIALFIGFIISAFSTRVSFEFDFDKMLEHSKDVRDTDKLVDLIYDRSVTPSTFAAFTKEEAIAVENHVKDKYYPKIIKSIVSGATLVPEDQEQKSHFIASIGKRISALKDKRIEDATGVNAKAIRTWVEAKPFKFSDLPSYIRDTLRGNKENIYMVYVYPTEHMNTGDAVNRFAGMIHETADAFPKVLIGSDAGIFNDILDLIKRDGTILVSLIFIFVAVFIWITLRSFREMVFCYGPFLLALPLFIGLMGITGVKFNIFNIALIPAFIAVGIEIPIQLMQRAREIRSGFKAVSDIAVGLQLSLVTTAIGFGVLVFTRAGVLKSLGWMSIMATGAIWLVGLFLQPAILELWFFKNRGSFGDSNKLEEEAYN